MLLLLLSRFSPVRLCATPRQQPTRLPCPWDSPGKNTGVGCHFLLQCMRVKSESEVAQLRPTLRDPMDCSPPGSSAHGIFQARVLTPIMFCVLDSICKWSQIVFVYLWFISHSIMPSRSIHVVANGEIWFLFGWVIFDTQSKVLKHTPQSVIWVPVP